MIYFGNTKINTGTSTSTSGLKNDGDGKKFLSDEGTYKAIINDNVSDSDDTTYSAKQLEEKLTEVKNSLVVGQDNNFNMWQKTTLNATANTPITYVADDDVSLDKIIVQCYKFVPGEKDVTHIISEFNEGDESSFYHTDNVEFNGAVKIKDSYILENSLNSDGFYESEVISKDVFVILNGIEVV